MAQNEKLQGLPRQRGDRPLNRKTLSDITAVAPPARG